jgi:hypothetical protein
VAKSVIKKFATIVIAIQLALSACGPKAFYAGPERSPEKTAIVRPFNTDCEGRIRAELIAIDDQVVQEGRFLIPPPKRASVLPGVHTFRASWSKRSCGGEPGFGPMGLLVIPLILIALPFVLARDRKELPDYGEGTRDFVATLEAGKEYQFRVRGEDGKVFLWIEEEETGAVVGGESPDEKAPDIEVAKSPEETAALSAHPTIVSWNGKWFAKDGAWSLYLDVENGTFTGRALRRGTPFRMAGTISTDYIVAGRVDDERGDLTGSLSGMFPSVSVYQDGELHASFELEKRE